LINLSLKYNACSGWRRIGVLAGPAIDTLLMLMLKLPDEGAELSI
jgi:hypothetical protein